MVKRLMQAAALAGVMSLSPVVSARAATVCSTGSLVVCVDFTLANTGVNAYSLTVKYASSTGGGVLTDFGVDGSAASAFTATGVSGSGSFTAGSNCSLQDDACASANAPVTSSGLTVGQTAVLSFTSSASFNGDFSSTFYNAHIQAFPNLPNCSVKLGNGNQYDTQGTGGSFNAPSACGSTTTTPEPASLFLFGTGLIGLGGGMVVRRRRHSTDA
jgi:hypothetical protein